MLGILAIVGVVTFMQYAAVPSASLPAEKTNRKRMHTAGERHLQMTADNTFLFQTANKRPSVAAKVGYVVAESYSNTRVTHSLGDVLLLQCWVGMSHMKMVTPVVQGTALVTPVKDKVVDDQIIPLAEFYDMDEWKDYATKNQAGEMVDISDFLAEGPRSVVVMNLLANCSDQATKTHTELDYSILQNQGFVFTKEICVTTKQLSAAQLLDKLSEVYNSVDGPATLLLREWGVRKNHKLPKDHQCKSYANTMTSIRPSKKVLSDSTRYIDKYYNGGDYISVVLSSEATKVKNFPLCLERSLTFLHIVQGQQKPSSIFLTVQGRNIETLLNFQVFFRALFHENNTLSNWGQQIRGMSSLDHQEYQALVQQVISWRAGCMIVAGGGSYQRYLIQKYQERISQNGQTKCLVAVRQCFA